MILRCFGLFLAILGRISAEKDKTMNEDDIKSLFRQGIHDQMTQAMKELAQITASYYKGLIEADMGHVDALMLTNTFVEAYISQIGKKGEGK